MMSDEIAERSGVPVDGVRLLLDRDFERAGFDPSGLEGEGLTIGFSQRLGADPWFIAVLIGVGWRTFDAVTKQATSRAIDRLLEFARSRNKRLKLECQAHQIDPRVETLMGSLETASREEFDAAIRTLPILRDRVNAIIAEAEDPIRELYFVWQYDHWEFTYYISISGDIVEKR